MPEENKNFILIKTSPNDVFFVLHPVSNPTLSREIYLTRRHPKQILPLDWALGIVADNALYNMYKTGKITFDKNDELAKAAYDAGVWFDEHFDFAPAKETDNDDILKVLKLGVRTQIENCIKKYGEEKVKNVAIVHLSELTQGVVSKLESIFKIQLTMMEDRITDTAVGD